jgi:hypothetical protein
MTMGMAFVFATDVRAQDSRLDAGVQFALLNVPRLVSAGATQPGIGGLLTYSVNDRWGIDGLFAYFPTGDADALAGGRKVEALAGVRAGHVWRQLGLFGKARPGLVRYSRGAQFGVCVLIFPPPAACFVPENRFALDLGAVVEYHVSNGAALRLDIGDTKVRRPLDGTWSNNFQMNAGVTFRLR